MLVRAHVSCFSTPMADLTAHLAMLRTDAGVSALARATRDRIGGSRLARVRAWMHSVDSRCVSCGFETSLDVSASHPRHAELGHLIAASEYAKSSKRVGFVEGNIALMCHTCNADANEADKSFEPCDLIADAWVPMVWAVTGQTRRGTNTLAAESRATRAW